MAGGKKGVRKKGGKNSTLISSTSADTHSERENHIYLL